MSRAASPVNLSRTSGCKFVDFQALTKLNIILLEPRRAKKSNKAIGICNFFTANRSLGASNHSGTQQSSTHRLKHHARLWNFRIMATTEQAAMSEKRQDEISKDDLANRIDELLETYLLTVDAYEQAQRALSSHLSSVSSHFSTGVKHETEPAQLTMASHRDILVWRRRISATHLVYVMAKITTTIGWWLLGKCTYERAVRTSCHSCSEPHSIVFCARIYPCNG